MFSYIFLNRYVIRPNSHLRGGSDKMPAACFPSITPFHTIPLRAPHVRPSAQNTPAEAPTRCVMGGTIVDMGQGALPGAHPGSIPGVSHPTLPHPPQSTSLSPTYPSPGLAPPSKSPCIPPFHTPLVALLPDVMDLSSLD